MSRSSGVREQIAAAKTLCRSPTTGDERRAFRRSRITFSSAVPPAAKGYRCNQLFEIEALA
jgi:hypothetical protein